MTKDSNIDTTSPSEESETVAPDRESALEIDSSLAASKESADINVESKIISPKTIEALPLTDPSEETYTGPLLVNYTPKAKEIQYKSCKFFCLFSF